MVESYGGVLLWFTVLPIVALGAALRRRVSRAHVLSILVVLAVVYAATVPWDNVAVARGYWSFARPRTWGVWLWHLPLEEYLFFGLQSVLAALILVALLERARRGDDRG